MIDRPSSVLRQSFASRAPDLTFDHRPLATWSRWRVGGIADVVVIPASTQGLTQAIAAAKDLQCAWTITGDSTNILFDDAGFRGVVIRVGKKHGGVAKLGGNRVEVGAGQWVPTLVKRLIGWGLAGATHAIGIPGTLGGLICMNGGSQRQGIGDLVESVSAIDANGTRVTLTREQLEFGYRTSAVARARLTLISAILQLTPGDASALRAEARQILRDRRAKFPKNRRNCGSVFVSDPALYATLGPPGRAIEQVGLKGHRIGDAQISPEHANFIVNLGNASSKDILALIALARRRVYEATGIAMLTEVKYLHPTMGFQNAHDAAGSMNIAGH